MADKSIQSQIEELQLQIKALEQLKPADVHCAAKAMLDWEQQGHDFSIHMDQLLQQKAMRLARTYGFTGKIACIQSAYRQCRYNQEMAGFDWDKIIQD